MPGGLDIILILDRLRSAHNTGNVFRLAEAVGAREIIACGYTPAPPHPKLAKTAMGADTLVPCRVMPDAATAVRTVRSEGVAEILALECVPGSPEVWERDYRYPLALVVGNEALGVSEEALALCDGAVRLPMFGAKASINVGNALAACLYAMEAKSRRKEC